MEKIFPSKISWWLFGPILGVLVLAALTTLLSHQLLALLLLLPALGFTGWVLGRTYYVVNAATRQLRIVSGPLRWAIPVAGITCVRPSHNLLSSPALSLDRLEVRYGKYDFILLSPADKAGFVAALAGLNPAIRHA